MNLPLSKSLSELPEFRFVLANLIARDLKVRYQDKALGFFWSLLHPALLLGIWYVVFSHVVRVDIGGPRYWAYLLPGLLVYQFIAGAITDGSRAVRDNSGIVRKVYVPMEILVCAAVTVKMVEFLLQLAIAIVLLAILHHGADGAAFSFYKTLVTLPGALLLVYIFVLGVAMPLAGFTVLYRDLDHLISLVLMALLYLSPIFWSVGMIADRSWMPLLALNPVADLIVLLRDPMYWGAWPANTAIGGGAVTGWIAAAVVSGLTFVIGYWLLGRVKHTLAEVV